MKKKVKKASWPKKGVMYALRLGAVISPDGSKTIEQLGEYAKKNKGNVVWGTTNVVKEDEIKNINMLLIEADGAYLACRVEEATKGLSPEIFGKFMGGERGASFKITRAKYIDSLEIVSTFGYEYEKLVNYPRSRSVYCNFNNN